MSQIGTVVKLENTPTNLYIVIHGIGKIDDGQKLYSGEDVWTVVKKRWVKGKEASFLLKSLNNKVPTVGQQLELILDDIPIKIEDNHPFEVIDSFILYHKDEAINIITISGILKLEPGDILSSQPGSYWKIIGTSRTLDTSGLSYRSMVSIESCGDPNILPLKTTKLFKIDDEITQQSVLNTSKVTKISKATKKKTISPSKPPDDSIA